MKFERDFPLLSSIAMEMTSVKKEELHIELYPVTLALPDNSSSAHTKVYRGFLGNKPFQLLYVFSSHETNNAGIEQFEKVLSDVRNNIQDICNEKTKEAEHIFDAILGHVNTHWNKHIESKYHGFIKTATIALAICFENHICIADRGKVCAYVVANKGLRAYQAVSTIVDGVGSTAQHSTTLFESSMCGPLIPNTRILIASPTIKLIGGLGEIGNILQKPTTTLQEISSRIIKKIEHKISESSFFVIIDLKKNTDYLQNRAPSVPPIHEQTKKDSKYFLKKTGIILRSFLFSIFQKFTFQKNKKDVQETPDIGNWKKEKKRTPKETIIATVKGIKIIFLKIIFGILVPIYTLIKRGFKKYLELPRIKQAIVAMLLATGILLVSTLVYNNHQAKTAQQEEKIATLINTLTEQKNRLDTILPFQDGEKIDVLLSEVTENIKQLQALQGDKKPAALSILSELQVIQTTLEKKIPVTEKEILTINSDTHHHLHSIANGYIVYNDNGEIYLENQKLPISQSILPTIQKISGDNTLLLESEGKYFSYSFEEKTLSETQIPLMDSEKLNIKIPYSDFIYTISKNGEVLKHTAALSGYGKAILWGKGEVTNAHTASIATAIYIASSDTIIKMFKGKQETFNTKLVMPKLNHISQIYAHPTSARVHVCEASNGRIITLSQQGEVTAQYQTKPFDSCAINETELTAYIIRDNRISSFSIIK